MYVCMYVLHTHTQNTHIHAYILTHMYEAQAAALPFLK